MIDKLKEFGMKSEVKSKVNWRNWKRLLEFLKTRRPKEIDMGQILCIPEDDNGIEKSLSPKFLREIHCGTVGCIAGWGQVLFAKSKDDLSRSARGFTQSKLGLDDEQIGHLYDYRWDRTVDIEDPATQKRRVIQYMEKALKKQDVMVQL